MRYGVKLWWDVRVCAVRCRWPSIVANSTRQPFSGWHAKAQIRFYRKSPLFRAEYREAWSAYDPDLANKLLDEAGLDKRGSGGERLLPDGRPAGSLSRRLAKTRWESDVLELIRDHWYDVGIKIFVRVSQRELLRRRVKGGGNDHDGGAGPR